MKILSTLKANKMIVIGGGLGIALAPMIQAKAASFLPSVTGTKVGAIGLNLVLAGTLIALGSMNNVPTTAAVAAATPFIVAAGLKAAGQ